MKPVPDPQPDEIEGAAASTAAAPTYPGEGFQLGEYTITGILGQGAMATVYQATDRSDNEVAIKVFVEGAGISKTMLERFRREAEATKKLRQHPNILTVYATGQEGPYHYIVMESIQRSKTLDMALETTTLSIADILLIHIKIARALHFAHARRIVHRDVKPSNILMDEFGEPRLADFGVAAMADWPSCTVTGALTGTPLYMSPEQARSERASPSSDAYSLGMVLYEALTGVLPFQTQHGSPVRDVLKAVTEEEPRRPRLFRKEISPDLEAVILKSIEKEPHRRYISAEAFAVDLERALIGRKVSARHFSVLDHVRHRARKHRQALALIAFISVVAAVLQIHFSRQIEQVQYESLMHYVQMRNATYRHAAVSAGQAQPPDASRIWVDIRMARQAMRTGDWERARRLASQAVEQAVTLGDDRTKAIAQLDEARCAIMLYNQELAMALYQHIAQTPGASPATVATAQMEFLALALLREDRARADAFLAETPIITTGPMRAIMDMMLERTPIEPFASAIPQSIPAGYRNDAWLTVALRHHLDGETRKSVTALRACLQTSTTPHDWPAPFARMLSSDLIRE